jgi:hypothetical protein
MSKPPELSRISKTHNSWNPEPELSQVAYFPINLILKNKIVKNISILRTYKRKKIEIKNNKD